MVQASANTQQPVRSVDGGHTWQTFPALPSDYSLQNASIAASTPDGSLFVRLVNDPVIAVFRLAPGANTWTPEYTVHLSSQAQPYPDVAAVSANVKGQPQTIWGILESSGAGQITLQLYQRPT